MNFQIMQHHGGREFIPAVHRRTRKPLIYNDAKKAAAVATRLTRLRGVKFQPRPVNHANDWHERERRRFATGEYQPVLWTGEKWWKEIDGHFAHISVKDKTRIAFTPDAEKGAADRQTAILPGKYLQQFFGDVLNAEQIREFAMQHSTKFEQNELKLARTVEEIEHVYKVGPTSSCFAKTTKANLYASGDFAVAYIEDANGKITARAVCAPERKIYPYIYGDRERLGTLLKNAGYRESTQGRDYAGLRLLKKWHWDGFYADFYPSRAVSKHPTDDEYLVVGS